MKLYSKIKILVKYRNHTHKLNYVMDTRNRNRVTARIFSGWTGKPVPDYSSQKLRKTYFLDISNNGDKFTTLRKIHNFKENRSIIILKWYFFYVFVADPRKHNFIWYFNFNEKDYTYLKWTLPRFCFRIMYELVFVVKL